MCCVGGGERGVRVHGCLLVRPIERVLLLLLVVVGQSQPACAAATLSRGHKNYLQLNALNQAVAACARVDNAGSALQYVCVRQLWQNACNVTLGNALLRLCLACNSEDFQRSAGAGRGRGQAGGRGQRIRFGVQFVSREFL